MLHKISFIQMNYTHRILQFLPYKLHLDKFLHSYLPITSYHNNFNLIQESKWT